MNIEIYHDSQLNIIIIVGIIGLSENRYSLHPQKKKKTQLLPSEFCHTKNQLRPTYPQQIKWQVLFLNILYLSITITTFFNNEWHFSHFLLFTIILPWDARNDIFLIEAVDLRNKTKKHTVTIIVAAAAATTTIIFALRTWLSHLSLKV